MSHHDQLHIAIIMDGNGRWAKNQGLSRINGHEKGAKAAEDIIEYCTNDPSIQALTLFGFSYENWDRPQDEVDFLMNLLKKVFSDVLPKLETYQIQCRVLGEVWRLPDELQTLIQQVESFQPSEPKLHLNIALSYGGRNDMVCACKHVVNQVLSGALKQDEINADVISHSLLSSGMPDPDLLIRTGGEKRLSNFLLWQLAYTELYFSDLYWPEFSVDDLQEALENYHGRDRRYGAKLG